MRPEVPCQRARVGRLTAETYADRTRVAAAAAALCAGYLRQTIARRGEARVAFGGAPAPAAFFARLVRVARTRRGFRWSLTRVLPVEEYGGPPAARPGPGSCARRLRTLLLRPAGARNFLPLLDPDAGPASAGTACAAFLQECPLDLICLAVGTGGSLGFNLPAVADFCDPLLVKPIAVPSPSGANRPALTLTLPVFRAARRLVVLAHGAGLASTVQAILRDPITTACPATLLRLHADAFLLLDAAAAALAFPPGGDRRPDAVSSRRLRPAPPFAP